MGYPVLRLEALGLDPLVLDFAAGYAVQMLDLGDAATRAVVQDAPDADGTIDTTQFVGARVVAMSVQLIPKFSGVSKELMRRRLRAFTHPRLRPILYMQLDGQAEQLIRLRRSTWSNLIQNPSYAPVALQFVAPDGIIESAELHTANANASATGLEGGFTFDLSFDLTFTGGVVIGETSVVNAGDADAYPLIRLYGLCTEPTIVNETTGQTLAFVGLTINAGDFVEIDTRAKTVRYNGDPANSQYNKFDFANSEWWTLQPGTNVIRFAPLTSSFPSNAEINWRDAWL